MPDQNEFDPNAPALPGVPDDAKGQHQPNGPEATGVAESQTQGPAPESTFQVSEELRAKFLNLANQGSVIEIHVKVFNDDMLVRATALRDEGRQLWAAVFAEAGLSQEDFAGSFDPETGTVIFEPQARNEGQTSWDDIFKKLFGDRG
jgi:hypothetical protein